MSPILHVKTRLLLAATVFIGAALQAADTPDPKEILETVRTAQTKQDRVLAGRLRNGAQVVPFKLSVKDGTVRWDFVDPPQALLRPLGDKDSRLEEVGKAGPQKISAARFDDKVRDSDISYE